MGIAQQRPHQTLVGADGPPPASESRATSATRWYQFCICDIVSALRMSMHGVRTFTESVFLQRTTWPRKRRRQKPRRQPPRKWQRRPQRKRSSRDRDIATSWSPPRTQSETSPKDLKGPLQPLGIAARKIRPGPGCCIVARSLLLARPKA